MNDKVKKELMVEAEDWIESIYEKGDTDGFNRAHDTYDYKRGLDDAWGCARKIIKIWYSRFHQDPNAFNDFFELNGKLGDDVFDLFFQKYSASEAIEKLKQHEEQKKPVLSVGDVVVYKADFNNKNRVEYIVTYIFTDSLYFNAIDENGFTYEDMEFDDSMIKTGKRYEIHLKEVKNDKP